MSANLKNQFHGNDYKSQFFLPFGLYQQYSDDMLLKAK